jgi:hypothetical protein
MGNRGQKEPVCLDEPQKSLPDLGKSLKSPPPHLYPENPLNPLWKSPQTNTRSCAQIPLTHNCLPSILPLPKSEFLSKDIEPRQVLLDIENKRSDPK